MRFINGGGGLASAAAAYAAMVGVLKSWPPLSQLLLALAVGCVAWAVLVVLFGLAAARWRERRQPVRPDMTDPNAPLFQRRRVHLNDLVRDIHPALIRNRTFEDCDIIGPAVLHVRDFGVLENTLMNVGSVGVLVVPVGMPMTGMIVASGCVFRGCAFHEVVFAGDEEFAKKVKSELLVAGPQSNVITAADRGTDVRCSCGWTGSIDEVQGHTAAAHTAPMPSRRSTPRTAKVPPQ